MSVRKFLEQKMGKTMEIAWALITRNIHLHFILCQFFSKMQKVFFSKCRQFSLCLEHILCKSKVQPLNILDNRPWTWTGPLSLAMLPQTWAVTFGEPELMPWEKTLFLPYTFLYLVCLHVYFWWLHLWNKCLFKIRGCIKQNERMYQSNKNTVNPWTWSMAIM